MFALTIAELAELDLGAAGIEGVSGATMTSIAMAQTLVQTAQAVRDAKPAVETPRWAIAARDWGTAAVVCGGLWLAFSGLRGRRLVRVAFQLLLIVSLGFVNGDMLSQSLLVVLGMVMVTICTRGSLMLVQKNRLNDFLRRRSAHMTPM